MVVLVDLNPTKGSETGKVRPCVVVTNNEYNRKVPVIQVVPITGWNPRKGRIRTNVALEATQTNGLSKKSVADCLQTRPIDKNIRLVKVIGTVSEATITKINEALRIVFDLDE